MERGRPTGRPKLFGFKKTAPAELCSLCFDPILQTERPSEAEYKALLSLLNRFPHFVSGGFLLYIYFVSSDLIFPQNLEI
jgi:hypothetical protein